MMSKEPAVFPLASYGTLSLPFPPAIGWSGHDTARHDMRATKPINGIGTLNHTHAYTYPTQASSPCATA